jgi:hypothetical protein
MINEADQKLIEIIKNALKGFKLRNRVLIKPLPAIMVEVEREMPVFDKDEDGNFILDENGIKKYSKTEIIKEEVQSSYRKGIVLKLPFNINKEEFGVEEGMTVLYPSQSGLNFDQIKDSVFIDPFNIVGIYE